MSPLGTGVSMAAQTLFHPDAAYSEPTASHQITPLQQQLDESKARGWGGPWQGFGPHSDVMEFRDNAQTILSGEHALMQALRKAHVNGDHTLSPQDTYVIHMPGRYGYKGFYRTFNPMTGEERNFYEDEFPQHLLQMRQRSYGDKYTTAQLMEELQGIESDSGRAMEAANRANAYYLNHAGSDRGAAFLRELSKMSAEQGAAPVLPPNVEQHLESQARVPTPAPRPAPLAAQPQPSALGPSPDRAAQLASAIRGQGLAPQRPASALDRILAPGSSPGIAAIQQIASRPSPSSDAGGPTVGPTIPPPSFPTAGPPSPSIFAQPDTGSYLGNASLRDVMNMPPLEGLREQARRAKMDLNDVESRGIYPYGRP